MHRRSNRKTETVTYRLGSRAKPVVVWLLVLDLSARPNFPTELHGFNPRTDMSECLLICQVAFLLMYFICACIIASSEHLCRLHRQSTGPVSGPFVLDDDSSPTWGHAVQVWRPSLVLPLDCGHRLCAVDNFADDARFRVGCVEPAVGDPALDHARQVGQASGGGV